MSLLEEVTASLATLSEEQVSEQVQLHLRLQRSLAISDGDGDGDGDGDYDSDGDPVGAEGIEVVAGFIERIVSRTEVTVTNLQLRLEHREHVCSGGDGDEDGDGDGRIRTSSVTILVPWLAYGDADENSDGDGNVAPSFNYVKLIRFHDFRVSLLDHPHSHPHTIVFGDPNQQCSIRIRASLADAEQSRVDFSCFIQSLRMMSSPTQVCHHHCPSPSPSQSPSPSPSPHLFQ